MSPPCWWIGGKSAVPEHGANDKIFALGVCQLGVVAMNAVRLKTGFPAGASGVIIRRISDLAFEKPTPTRREGGHHNHMALSLARAGQSILCRNASDYAKIGGCRSARARGPGRHRAPDLWAHGLIPLHLMLDGRLNGIITDRDGQRGRAGRRSHLTV